MGAKMKYTCTEDVFKEMSDRIQEFKGLTYEIIGTNGTSLKETRKSVQSKVVV
jgi:hypothetical protein